MNDSQDKHVVYDEIASVLTALGEPHRLELLELLCQCERNVDVLGEMLDLGITTVSHHLQVLKRARLVEHVKVGRRVYYSATSMAISLWNSVAAIAAHKLAVVKCASEELFEQSDDSESLDYDELVRRIGRGEAVLIDVRPEEEYAAGHVPGAISISLERLREGAGALPRDKPVFAYCRGRYCVLSREAVQLLEEEGFTATRLPVGVAEWKAAGAALSSTKGE
jgi:rhodanese-related sulfurtransferase/DNA-binding HxlR family transcriptional regulator